MEVLGQLAGGWRTDEFDVPPPLLVLELENLDGLLSGLVSDHELKLHVVRALDVVGLPVVVHANVGDLREALEIRPEGLVEGSEGSADLLEDVVDVNDPGRE